MDIEGIFDECGTWQSNKEKGFTQTCIHSSILIMQKRANNLSREEILTGLNRYLTNLIREEDMKP